MHCTQCGTLLSEGARFCGNCGGATGHAAAPPAFEAMPRPGRPRSSAVFWAIGAAVGVLVIFAVLGKLSTTIGGTASDSSFNASYAEATKAMREAMNGGLSDTCTPDRFKIKEQNGTDQYGYLTVVGVIHNGCSQAAAVQLKLNQYDSNGHLVATDDEWPASVNNIGPHQDYDFKVLASAPDNSVKYSVFPESVRRW
jgi:hypothetical protein